jgi:hypothetical protein
VPATCSQDVYGWRGCGLVFADQRSFDRHLAPVAQGRSVRCLTESELHPLFEKNTDGEWVLRSSALRPPVVCDVHGGEFRPSSGCRECRREKADAERLAIEYEAHLRRLEDPALRYAPE